MSKLREAAAAWIETGRWLATVEILSDQIRRLDKAKPEDRERHAVYIIEQSRDRLDVYEQTALSLRGKAEQLMLEHEHPGAVLGRRLLASARAARAAWRAR